MKNDGFKNEAELIKKLNNQYFSTLNRNLQRLISQSFKNYKGLISCTLEAGNKKSDIKIQIANEIHTYSVKMGKGNSVHQEPLENFLYFLKQHHELPKQIEQDIQAYIWGDGTLDGKGEPKQRISAKKFKKRYPEKIDAINRYFEKYKTLLIRRFLIDGVGTYSSAEFIYYGTPKKGIVSKSEEVLDWVSKHEAKGTVKIGKLNFQAWNRNLKGKAKSEKRRGVVQLKWSGIKKDLKKITKLNFGKLQEVEFVQELNRKEKRSHWEKLGLELQQHHAIHVKYQKYGKFNQQKVWAKADAFIAKGEVPKHYLEHKNYYLDEDDLHKFQLTSIEKTGISIKQIDSRQYQIVKMAPSTFEKLFGTNILAAGASLYYKKRKKLAKNEKILEAWGITPEYFFHYYAHALGLTIDSVTNSRCQKCLKKIKRYANKEIVKTIQERKEISDFVFFGKGNFEEPFTAPWLFEHGHLKKNYPQTFSVTTGSGRSRGKCTIVLKPKKVS
jgi:hypothetical protein